MVTRFSVFILTALFMVHWTVEAKQPTQSFRDAKKFLNSNLDLFDHKTIYCSCKIDGKKVDLKSCGYKIQTKDIQRAHRLEWEHVVPAEAFGQSFKEWQEGDPIRCQKNGKKFKGRKCAEKNSEFAKMEGDLYNLFPEIGELNGLRSNFSMAEIAIKPGKFGKCSVKLQNRKFEPQDQAKGIVARTYLNFDHRYPGRGVVSDKNRKLFAAWNKLYPVNHFECRRWKILEMRTGYPHMFLNDCKDRLASGGKI